eukprot:SAG31_NODE_1189_length_9480_cov_19.686174_7_plen_75_part_00
MVVATPYCCHVLQIDPVNLQSRYVAGRPKVPRGKVLNSNLCGGLRRIYSALKAVSDALVTLIPQQMDSVMPAPN